VPFGQPSESNRIARPGDSSPGSPILDESTAATLRERNIRGCVPGCRDETKHGANASDGRAAGNPSQNLFLQAVRSMKSNWFVVFRFRNFVFELTLDVGNPGNFVPENRVILCDIAWILADRR
jgi:hypothetical protein